ncbi:MAG: hypothetical protein SNJ70_01085 [Armatimonadota bacterium]
MTGAVHALVGAALGSLFENKSSAFLTGVISHAICDVIPHKDLSAKAEVALMACVMTILERWKGLDSTEFWGALGAISPDIEHGLSLIGILPEDLKLFPTHIENGKYHGKKSDEQVSQLIIVFVCLFILLIDRE